MTAIEAIQMQSADEAKQVILGVTERWARSFNSGNLKELVGLYADNAYFSSPRTALLTGRAAIEQHFHALIKTGWKIKIVLHDVRALDSSVIIGVGDYILTGSGRRQNEQIAGHWGFAAVGATAEITMHISNSPAVRAEMPAALAAEHDAARLSSYERPY